MKGVLFEFGPFTTRRIISILAHSFTSIGTALLYTTNITLYNGKSFTSLNITEKITIHKNQEDLKTNIKEIKKYTYTKVLDIVGSTAQKIAIKR